MESGGKREFRLVTIAGRDLQHKHRKRIPSETSSVNDVLQLRQRSDCQSNAVIAVEQWIRNIMIPNFHYQSVQEDQWDGGCVLIAGGTTAPLTTEGGFTITLATEMVVNDHNSAPPSRCSNRGVLSMGGE